MGCKQAKRYMYRTVRIGVAGDTYAVQYHCDKPALAQTQTHARLGGEQGEKIKTQKPRLSSYVLLLSTREHRCLGRTERFENAEAVLWNAPGLFGVVHSISRAVSTPRRWLRNRARCTASRFQRRSRHSRGPARRNSNSEERNRCTCNGHHGCVERQDILMLEFCVTCGGVRQ